MSFLYNLTTYNDIDIWKVLEQNEYEETPDFIIKSHNHLLIVKYRYKAGKFISLTTNVNFIPNI